MAGVVRRDGLREAEDRFWEKVDFSASCWEWLATRDPSGYGRFHVREAGRTRGWAAHRFAWETLCGPIPEGLQIDHLCKNRRCVNPDHLEVVTQAENLRRGYAGAYMRARSHCVNGHPYDEENTATCRFGRRVCRACRAARDRRVRARKRAEREERAA